MNGRRQLWVAKGRVIGIGLASIAAILSTTQCSLFGSSHAPGPLRPLPFPYVFDTVPPNADTALFLVGSDTSWVRASPETTATLFNLNLLRAGRIIGKLTTTGRASPLPSTLGDMFVYIDSVATETTWRMIFFRANSDSAYLFRYSPVALPGPVVREEGSAPGPMDASEAFAGIAASAGSAASRISSDGGGAYVSSCNSHACPMSGTATPILLGQGGIPTLDVLLRRE